MAYRDEHEALRARLDATEQRLHEAERALREANLRASAAEREPYAQRAQGHARATDVAESFIQHVYVRSTAVFWIFAGIVFVAWKLLDQAEAVDLGSIAKGLAVWLGLFAGPAGFVLVRTRPAVKPAPVSPRIRVVGGSREHEPQVRVEEETDRESAPEGAEAEQEVQRHATPRRR